LSKAGTMFIKKKGFPQMLVVEAENLTREYFHFSTCWFLLTKPSRIFRDLCVETVASKQLMLSRMCAVHEDTPFEALVAKNVLKEVLKPVLSI
jgi:hypothetical protein